MILTVGQLVNAFMGPVAVLLLMTGYEREAAATSLLAVAVAICLTLILFPVAGVDGAAWGSAAALTTWNVSLAVLTRRRLGIRATVFARARGTSAVGG